MKLVSSSNSQQRQPIVLIPADNTLDIRATVEVAMGIVRINGSQD